MPTPSRSSDGCILVLGTPWDASVSSVVPRLRQDGVRVLIANCMTGQDNLPRSLSAEAPEIEPIDLAVGLDRLGKPRLEYAGSVLDGPILIWDKVKLFDPGLPLSFSGRPSAAWYRTSEWLGFYEVIRQLFPLQTVNSPAATRAFHKPRQQVLAASVGFKVPESVIATRKTYLQALHDRCGDLIVKTVADSRLQGDVMGEASQVIPTVSVSRSQIDSADPQAYALCPHFAQERIVKQYELRVVYVSGAIFAFRLQSQSSALTSVDWRLGLRSLEPSPVDLPDRIAAQVRRFMQVSGMFSGSLDIIIDNEDQAWFLECNQDGAWGSYDSLVSGAISLAFSSELQSCLVTIAQKGGLL